MTIKPAPADHVLHDLISQRWSPRAFDPARAVSREDLLSVMEAARWSASCFNDQPWRYVVCDKSSDPDSWQQLLDCLVESNQVWARNAPVLLVSVAMSNFGHNGKPNRWAMYDTGAATASLSIQAVALGLALHQMGGFDADKARAAFALPADCMPMAVAALGYAAAADTLDEALQAKEVAPRSRKPLAELCFWGKWNG
jgi:nitroreductase